ncbi:MAG: DUF6279 family lipoprotein [Rubrivivax sp.]|nr:DUF6279 family lipoprotein [Rubrivivax sp.]
MLALALGACSLARLAYDNGPTLAMRWLDGWFDLDAAQEAQARPALARWFEWHRTSQLPDYVQTVARWRQLAKGEVTPDQLCAEADQLRAKVSLAVEQVLPDAAALLPLLTPAQLAHLERTQADRLADWREEHLQPRMEDRRRAMLDRAVEQAEDLYGPLQPQQLALLEAAQQSSPLDAELWLAQREARNRLLLEGLRQARTLESTAARTQALRALAQRYQQPVDRAYASMLARWQAHSCDTAARLHHLSSLAQRQHLDQRLAGWEEDLRALAARGSG